MGADVGRARPLVAFLVQCFPGDSQVDVKSGCGLSRVVSAMGLSAHGQ